ncbi:MAG: leucine-rich repeat domain-containing protein, partial [Candidatus Methanoplasma sp.]|nr:leucine-rich repeat domain-containing protein [Candidatus Methanoplasma sp.]
LPDSLRTIDSRAFENCSKLSSIAIPAGVTYVGIGAFNNCIQLSSIAIPASVVLISPETFTNCVLLSSITFGGDTIFYGGSFENCVSLKSVTVSSAHALSLVYDWTLTGAPSLIDTLTVDIAGEVYLDPIEVIDGKTLILSASATTAFGGTLYAADGATVLQGADRAGHSYVAANGAWIQSDVPYVPAPDMITVTLDPAGGVVEYLFSEILPGDPFTLLLPVKTDNIFAGWKLGNSGPSLAAGTVVYPEEDVTYTAQWTSPVPGVSYVSVAYNGNGGIGHMFAVSIVSGSPYELPDSTLTPPADYSFIGWKLNDTGDLLHPGDVINPSSNIVIYAQWESSGTGGGDSGNLGTFVWAVIVVVAVIAVICLICGFLPLFLLLCIVDGIVVTLNLIGEI